MVDINTQKPRPIVVVEGTVFVATIGATVAAATGVTGLKIGFCGEQIWRTLLYTLWHGMIIQCCPWQSTVCSNLCHGVCGLWFLSPNCRVRWQCDPCRRVPRRLRPLNANSGWRRVNSQTWTPERRYSSVKVFTKNHWRQIRKKWQKQKTNNFISVWIITWSLHYFKF